MFWLANIFIDGLLLVFMPITKSNKKKVSRNISTSKKLLTLKHKREIGKRKSKRRLNKKQLVDTRLLHKIKFKFKETKRYVSLRVKIPKILIGVLTLGLIAIAIIAIPSFEAEKSLKIVPSEQCDVGKIPKESIELYNKFGITELTNFAEFSSKFKELRTDMPGLVTYYGPKLGEDVPKNGAGVHFSSHSQPAFILIWKEPFYLGISSGGNFIDGNFYGDLDKIWFFDENNQRVCENRV